MIFTLWIKNSDRLGSDLCLRIHFQTHSNCSQNSFPCSHGIEVPVSLLAIGQGPLSTYKIDLIFFFSSCGAFHPKSSDTSIPSHTSNLFAFLFCLILLQQEKTLLSSGLLC